MNYWVNDLTCTGKNAVHVEPAGAEGTEAGGDGATGLDPTPTGNSTSVVSSAHVNEVTPALFPEQVVLVMSGVKNQSAGPPAAPLIRRDEAPGMRPLKSKRARKSKPPSVFTFPKPYPFPKAVKDSESLETMRSISRRDLCYTASARYDSNRAGAGGVT